MMKSYLRFFCLLLACFGASPAFAADTKHSYLILGPGAYSCKRVVSDLTQDAKRKDPASVIIYSNWLAGNLTSYNRDTKGTYSILGDTSFTDALAWTVAYCQEKPDSIFASAADALALKLKPQRYTTMPEPQEQERDKDDEEENSEEK